MVTVEKASKCELGKESHGKGKMLRCWNRFFLASQTGDSVILGERRSGELVISWLSHGLCWG